LTPQISKLGHLTYELLTRYLGKCKKSESSAIFNSDLDLIKLANFSIIS